jgi:ribosomal protein L11 methyltransferase
VADKPEKNHWLEVKIQSDGELAEALAEVLGRFVSGGVIVESVTRYNAHSHENEPTGKVQVTGYLTVDENLEAARQKIEEAFWHLSQITPIPKPKYTGIKDQNWMSAWKKHFSPLPVGEKILVLPAWQEPKQGEPRHIIRINPAMAFGTGTHPTTQLCMRLLEKHIQPGINVIDVGCGSGILSIAAFKLGAKHLLAVDVDDEAIKSTLENAGLNDIPPSALEIRQGSVKEIRSGDFSSQKAPLVLVNILASIILRLFEEGLGNIVEENGILLLSGILEYQEQEILSAANQAGFVLIEKITEADWVSFAMCKAGD